MQTVAPILFAGGVVLVTIQACRQAFDHSNSRSVGVFLFIAVAMIVIGWALMH